MTIAKPGDRVTIFEDPITETKPEGEATLKRFIQLLPGQPVMEMWSVLFDGEDDFPVVRSFKRHGANNRAFGFRPGHLEETA